MGHGRTVLRDEQCSGVVQPLPVVDAESTALAGALRPEEAFPILVRDAGRWNPHGHMEEPPRPPAEPCAIDPAREGGWRWERPARGGANVAKEKWMGRRELKNGILNQP